MTNMNEIFRLPVLHSLANARSLTQREALLLRDRGFGRTTRRWIVWRDDAGSIIVASRPKRQHGQLWEIHRVYR